MRTERIAKASGWFGGVSDASQETHLVVMNPPRAHHHRNSILDSTSVDSYGKQQLEALPDRLEPRSFQIGLAF
jgi:hypothetical protein